MAVERLFCYIPLSDLVRRARLVGRLRQTRHTRSRSLCILVVHGCCRRRTHRDITVGIGFVGDLSELERLAMVHI